jgi:hypothetical protein
MICYLISHRVFCFALLPGTVTDCWLEKPEIFRK